MTDTADKIGLLKWLLTHHKMTALLLVIGGGALFFLDRHPQLLQAEINGWVIGCVGLTMTLTLFLLHRMGEMERVMAECRRDCRKQSEDSAAVIAQLHSCIGLLSLMVPEERRGEVERVLTENQNQIADIMGWMRRGPVKLLPGGQRPYDPPA